ncbi:chaperone protein HSP31 [Ascobolus immersus RN42]|uniref:D-lactate dehydratase n=1 Tax=Ascobolus immersus RN42 TaxID=1160509 RepID=A0A3N4ICY7_ASCIM|nr:chaperone protein HSP31 [Ascobolus immersus RN42]
MTTSTLPRKVLIAVTSAHAPMYPGGEETGLFITEALHPFLVWQKAGFEIDFASEEGTYVPDHLSLSEDYLKGDDKKIWEDKNSDFRKRLDSLKKASDLNADEYGVFFAAGGHATLIDFPKAKGLQSVASKIWSKGGIVSAVCHGPAILPGIIDQSTGKPVISGKKVTGFMTKGEEELGALDTIKKWNAATVESAAAGVGAEYIKPEGPWAEFTVTDGRLVTGVNPQSAHKTGIEVLNVFEKL